MSQKTEKVASAYQQLAESEGGKHLMDWLETTADSARKDAVKLEPTRAWGRLQFADGLEQVATHIQQMCRLETIGKRTKQ